MENNYNKEFAYFLYQMAIGDYVNYQAIDILRVPGGWTFFNKIFVPFNNEYQTFAYSPTKEETLLKCPNCNDNFKIRINHYFQGDEYFCPFCNTIVKYAQTNKDYVTINKKITK